MHRNYNNETSRDCIQERNDKKQRRPKYLDLVGLREYPRQKNDCCLPLERAEVNYKGALNRYYGPNRTLQVSNCDIFRIFLYNIDCGDSLELPHIGN